MRETYGTLLQTTKDLAVDPTTTSSTDISNTETFLGRQINDTIQYLYQQIRNYKTQPLPKTMSTVIGQIFYHYPADLISLESLTITVGDIDYPLTAIHSQATWNKFQQLDITSSDIPQYFFPRQYDFGIFPKPNAVYTGTIVGNYLPSRLSVGDYTDGSVTVSQNSRTVTGAGTIFTASMVDRWFRGGDGGRWYKISNFVSATELTLETFFDETSISGSDYIIGQSPEVPEELHQYIPYRSAANYYGTVRRDTKQAQEMLNYFYTGDYGNPRRGSGIKGGILGVINRYKNTGRGNSQINRMHKKTYVNHWRDEAWATTLSAA